MPQDSQHAAQDTLRLSQAAKQQILSQLDRNQTATGSERRTMRVNFEAARVIVCLMHRQGGRAHYMVTPRNLAGRGLAFIHGQYVHTDTQCQIVLPRLDERWVQISGRVLRCRHFRGIVHEVSVGFDEPIDLPQFVRLNREQFERWQQEYAIVNPSAKQAQEEPPASRMAGNALVIDRSEAERGLLAHHLRQQGLTVCEAGSADQVRAQVKEGDLDIALVDIALMKSGGCEDLRDLQDMGFDGTVIGITADDVDGEQAQALSQKLGCHALLGKPIDVARLFQTVEQLLLFSAGSPSVLSTIGQDSPLRPMVEKFVQQARALGPTLQQALTARNVDVIRDACRQLKGAGPSFGFPSVALAAQDTLAALDQAQADLTSANRVVRELIHMLGRVRTD